MKTASVEALKTLETWVERQAAGLDMASNPDSLRSSFDKLLKVLSKLSILLVWSDAELGCNGNLRLF